MKISRTYNVHNGFTLLEMMFAVVIFSFALVSLMLIAGKGIVATATAKDQLVAQYLAEEAIEVVRNTRDINYISGDPEWLRDIVCTESSPCDIGYKDDEIRLVPGSGMLSSDGKGYYGGEGVVPGDGQVQKFSRSVYLEPTDGNVNQQTIVAEITWKQRNIDRKFVLKTMISNWGSSES